MKGGATDPAREGSRRQRARQQLSPGRSRPRPRIRRRRRSRRSTPTAGATGVASTDHRHRDVQRSDGRDVHRHDIRSSCAIRATRSSPRPSPTAPATRTATLTPTAALAATDDAHGDRQGRRDRSARSRTLAGNALATNFTWSFTTAATPPPPPPATTIWAPTVTRWPAPITDNNAVEIGTKFRADVAGFITGLRFYKFATQHRHPHRVICGRAPARCSRRPRSRNEIRVGVAAGQPLAHRSQSPRTRPTSRRNSAPIGHYAVNSAYFANAGVDNAPLHALANGIDGGNGVYAYGAVGTFPNQTFQLGVLLVSTSSTRRRSGQIRRRRSWQTTVPLNAATGVNANNNITATFSEAMDSNDDQRQQLRGARFVRTRSSPET